MKLRHLYSDDLAIFIDLSMFDIPLNLLNKFKSFVPKTHWNNIRLVREINNTVSIILINDKHRYCYLTRGNYYVINREQFYAHKYLYFYFNS